MNLIERNPITLDRVAIEDFVKDYQGKYPKNMKLINIRGCNGSGKSSIPLQLLSKDRGAFVFTLNGKDKATCFPSYGIVALGRYKTKTGGMDGLKGNQEKFELLDALWNTPFSIIMEGVIDSTIYSTYMNLFKELEGKEPKRKIGIMNLLPPVEVALERIQRRNGGKTIDEKAVISKWHTVQRNAEKFKQEGLNSWVSDNSNITLDQTLDWFFEEVKKNLG